MPYHIHLSPQFEIAVFLDTISCTCIFYDSYSFYDQITTDLDFKIIRQLNYNSTIEEALTLYDWNMLCFYLNHMIKYNIISVSNNTICCIENSYRSFIHKFAVPSNFTVTTIDPLDLSNNGQSLYEFSKSNFPVSDFQFSKKSVVVQDNYLHSYDLKSGLFQFVSTFATRDAQSQFLFFEDCKSFYHNLLHIGYKMFHFYTKMIDWRYHAPGALQHDDLALNTTKQLLKPDFEDDVDYVEYVSKYCFAKYKQAPKWYNEATPSGYTGFLRIGEFWHIEAIKTYRNLDDLQHDLCKQACKNEDYNIMEYVDTMDAVKANPNDFINKKQKLNEQSHVVKWDSMQPSPPESKSSVDDDAGVNLVVEEAINEALTQIQTSRMYWYTPITVSHFQNKDIKISKPAKISFKKPILIKITEQDAKMNAELAYFGEIKNIPMSSIDICCKNAKKMKLRADLTNNDLKQLSLLTSKEQVWYKKLVIFNLLYEAK